MRHGEGLRTPLCRRRRLSKEELDTASPLAALPFGGDLNHSPIALLLVLQQLCAKRERNISSVISEVPANAIPGLAVEIPGSIGAVMNWTGHEIDCARFIEPMACLAEVLCVADAHPQRIAMNCGECSAVPGKGCSTNVGRASIAKRSAVVKNLRTCVIIKITSIVGYGGPTSDRGMPINQPL